MEYNEIGFDFSNLEYGIISRKNSILLIISAITTSAFFIIFLIFFILYLAKVPIEINGVIREFYETEYKSFFSIFLLVMGGISFPGLIYSIFFFFKKPSPYIYITKDSNFETYYQINLSDTKILYIFSKIAFYYYPSSKRLEEINSYNDIVELKQKYLFWQLFADVKDYTIKNKTKKTILSFKKQKQRTVLEYRYTFYHNDSFIPNKITEMVQNKSSYRNSLNQINTYYFDDLNQVPNINLPQEIVAKFNQDY
jgi:hypothetical protein